MDPNNPTVALALALIARRVKFATSCLKKKSSLKKLTSALGTGSKFFHRAFCQLKHTYMRQRKAAVRSWYHYWPFCPYLPTTEQGALGN
jgi:hypothetical protein